MNIDIDNYYRPKFGIKIDKLGKGDWSLGIFLNHKLWTHLYYDKVVKESHEIYIYICFFKFNISIGFIEK